MRDKILKIIGGGEKYIEASKIKSKLTEDEAKRFDKAVYNFRKSGLVERPAGETRRYRLTQKGKAELEGTRPAKRKYTKRKTAVKAPPPNFNFSSTAELLQNNVSQVLMENEQLRNLLLQVHTTIGKALQLDKENENVNS